jgi:hypothetical protein
MIELLIWTDPDASLRIPPVEPGADALGTAFRKTVVLLRVAAAPKPL